MARRTVRSPTDCTRFTLRRATASDAPTLWSIRSAAIRETCRSHYSRQIVEHWAASPIPQAFAADIENGHCVVGVAGRRVAGFAELRIGVATVQAVFVAPDMQHRGLGQRLLTHIEAVAAQSGLAEISLDASLNVVPFYLAAGYSIVSEGTYTTNAGVELACVHMRKRLGPRG